MQQKPKLIINEQIKHLKKLNITFENTTENQAKSFLAKHSYLFKLKSFAKNYRKDANGYQNLDFEYLVKFSSLDSIFRSLVLELSLVCEHLIKTQICAISSENLRDDGYETVREFQENIDEKKEANTEKSNSVYIGEIVKKYSKHMPLWVFVEIANFGELIRFYEFYINKFNMQDDCYSLFKYVKRLRNAAAHNNCLLANFTRVIGAYTTGKSELKNTLRKYQIFQCSKRREKHNQDKILQIPIIHDFLCLAFVFWSICKDDGLKNSAREKILNFFQKWEYEPNFFKEETMIVKNYKFLKEKTQKILEINNFI